MKARWRRCAMCVALRSSDGRAQPHASMSLWTYPSPVRSRCGSLGRRGAGVGLEAVAFENPECGGRADVGKPEISSLWVKRALHCGAGINRGRGVAGPDGDMKEP